MRSEGFERGSPAAALALERPRRRRTRRKGYLTLTRAPGAGVDMFVKEWLALQVFLQGHPEYDADTLAREYRRDVGRFLAGERADAPAPPAGLLRT